MDDQRGIPSDLFFSADVLRLFDFLFLNFQNFHNFQNNCQKLFQSIHVSEMQTAFIDGHFILFLFHCDSYLCIRKTYFNDIISKYPIFYTLKEQDKILFLFNNVDNFICKKSVILFSNLLRKRNKS